MFIIGYIMITTLISILFKMIRILIFILIFNFIFFILSIQKLGILINLMRMTSIKRPERTILVLLLLSILY